MNVTGGLIDFGNLRKKSVKIVNDNKDFVPSGKRRMHLAGGRHHADRLRNATDVFRKAYIAFHLYRIPTEFVYTDYRHRTTYFEV